MAVKRKIRKKMVEGLEEADNGVWYVDNVVPKELKSLLASRLDAIANSSKKDFHPGSNDQVQDLIHPSMFPYIEGVSPVHDQTTLPQKSEESFFRRQYEDSTYQWLPAEFAVDAEGSVKIQTYINNLDEGTNEDLYRAIELMFELVLPMFAKVVFFLVDARKEIVSTKHVPEQQWERIMPKQLELMSLVADRLTGKRIPPVIIHDIVSRAKSGSMTMVEARRHRLELMKERKYKVDQDNQAWERDYTLSEH